MILENKDCLEFLSELDSESVEYSMWLLEFLENRPTILYRI